MKNSLFLSALMLGLFGCSTISTEPSKHQEVNLGDLESLKIGKTTSDVILRKFGEPPMQMASEKEEAISWLYSSQNNPDRQRASFIFDTKSHLLKEMNWMVYENENESEPSKVFFRYYDARFKEYKVQWQPADWIFSRSSYIDNTKGIAIITRTDRPDVVTLISFAKPGSIEEQDGLIDFVKPKDDDWKVIVDRREPNRSSASLE